MSLRLLIAVMTAFFLAACASSSKDDEAKSAQTPELDLTKDFPEPNSPLAKARLEKRGRVGNTGAIPALEECLDDPVPFVRYEVASQLGNLGAKSGYRALVNGLSDERVEMRFKCFEALQELTGNTFGYSHTAAPEVRKVAVDQWDAWLSRMESEEL
jgi:HEAT repeat protein